MRNVKRLFILSLVFIFSLSLSAGKLDKDLARGFDSISPMDAYNYVKTMALPKFAGRYTGHEGYTAAAKWAAAKFKKWGLKPISNKEGFLQAFPRPYAIIPQAKMTLLKGKKQEKVELKAEDEFLPLLATDSGDNTAELVFAGWGVSAPELGYDDYAGTILASRNTMNTAFACRWPKIKAPKAFFISIPGPLPIPTWILSKDSPMPLSVKKLQIRYSKKKVLRQ